VSLQAQAENQYAHGGASLLLTDGGRLDRWCSLRSLRVMHREGRVGANGGRIPRQWNHGAYTVSIRDALKR
jgi:hypothetical protein